MNTSDRDYGRGSISWMARHPVAANLAMAVLLIGGVLSALQIQKEVFPRFQLDIVTVEIDYPGAGPSEVETGVVQPVEEAVRGLEGIGEISSLAEEGSGSVTIKLVSGADRMQAFQNIDQAVARIRTFPEEADEPEVSLQTRKREAMEIGLFGDVDEWTLRKLAEQLRDRLLSSPEITLVELANVPAYITHVEIGAETLRRYNLTLPEVAGIISRSARDIPAGSVRTVDGEILLRFQERKTMARELRDIDIVAANTGVIRLGDIARIRDGFEEGNFHSRFNGVPSVEVAVFRTGDESPLDIEKAVLEVMTAFETRLPPAVAWRVDGNNARDFRQRLTLILKNGAGSTLIVLGILTLFLAARLGFWVMTGMAISYIGSVLFLPLLGVTINMVSLFGFLVALGIVVDDAIVIGENVFEKRKQYKDPMAAAISGTKGVARPVVFSILTTLIAFVPLIFIPGETGLFWRPLPVVVITVLVLSLFEALYILPSHLGHIKQGKNNHPVLGTVKRLQIRFSGWFDDGFVQGPYKTLFNFLLDNRYITTAGALALLTIIGSYANSAHMGMVNMPEVAADEIEAGVSMPVGTTPAQAGRMAMKLTRATKRMYEAHNLQEVAEGIKTNVRGQDGIDVEIVMKPPNERDMTAKEVIELWRNEIGDIHGIDTIQFEAERGPGGWQADISVDLSHDNIKILEKAGQRLVNELELFSNTSDIDDTFDRGKKRIDFRLLPRGRALGLTPEYVGQQLRGAFFGVIALRQQENNNETEIRVKLPESQRNDFSYLENFIIRTPGGTEVPLFEVTELTYTEAFASIARRNGKRVVTVSADVEPKREILQVINALNNDILPRLGADYPELTWQFQGADAEMRKSVRKLWQYFGLAMILIYALLAVVFKSYFQPLIVLSAIPFGVIGAVTGHIIMGYDLSLISMMGVVALSGVVLNSSIIMTDYANGLRNEKGRKISALEAVRQAGLRRFRPIMMTTLTTFGGLIPILSETSLQAQYLIPMAISLGFGVLFATGIILFLVPCLYMMLEDIKTLRGQEKEAVPVDS